MSVELSVLLGVVVAREKIDHPWQEHRWRAVSVFLDAPQAANWRLLMKDANATHYHAATLPLVLHRKETMSYRVNLANGEPSVYVVMREDSDPEAEFPLSIHTVTASPFEAQTHGEMAFDNVDRVIMPERLVDIVEAFVDQHPQDETFVKRKRQPHTPRDAPHTFGQESLMVLRERMTMHQANAEPLKSPSDKAGN